MRRLTAFHSGFPGGSCGTKHRRDFYDEKDKPKIGAFALVLAVYFVVYALGHPTGSFPWSNSVTYGVYLVYILLTGALLWAPFGEKQR